MQYSPVYRNVLLVYMYNRGPRSHPTPPLLPSCAYMSLRDGSAQENCTPSTPSSHVFGALCPLSALPRNNSGSPHACAIIMVRRCGSLACPSPSLLAGLDVSTAAAAAPSGVARAVATLLQGCAGRAGLGGMQAGAHMGLGARWAGRTTQTSSSAGHHQRHVGLSPLRTELPVGVWFGWAGQVRRGAAGRPPEIF